MRFKPDHKAETRKRIVEAASARFRRDGVENVSVPALMKEANLTHGGFYAHFGSKDDLVAEALRTALETSTARFAAAGEGAPELQITAVVDAYLSKEHRDHPELGCAVAALGADAARSSAPDIRRTLADGMRLTQAMVAATLEPRDAATRADDAIYLLASMVGALIVARILKDDPDASDHVLDVCRDRVKDAAAHLAARSDATP